jgi:hypothetical protein
MLGFGLRLDTDWQGAGAALLVAAAVLGVAAGRPTGPGAFVGGNDPQ